MCMPKVAKPPKAPKPVQPPTRASAEDIADTARKKRSTRQGYANWAFASSPEGAKDFGQNSQMPSLSAGTAQTLGA